MTLWKGKIAIIWLNPTDVPTLFVGWLHTSESEENCIIEYFLFSYELNFWLISNMSFQIYPIQGGSGSVQGVMFSNVQVSEVQFPIIIDQYYCDKSTCTNQSSAVALSGITYERIRGTYTVRPVHFACSDSLPCVDVTLTAIQLKPVQEQYHLYNPFCWQTFGLLSTPTVPPVDCLQIGKPSKSRTQSGLDSCSD